jgi:two-component system cell cycle response regulator
MPDDSKQTQKIPAREVAQVEERPTSPRAATVEERPSSPRTSAADERPSSPRTTIVDWPDEEASTRATDATIAMPPAPSPGHGTRALLTVVNGPNIGRVYSVRDGDTVIGRGKECHVRIDDAGASRSHARIYVDSGHYILEDLHSTNGTFVGGRRLDRVELTSGDRINVGPNVVVSFAVLDAQAERLAHQLYESSVRDPLTRAHNRRYLVERLASEIAYARRHNTRLSLLLFDLDHFKRVNDTHGHLAGDDVLRDVAALVSRMIRTEDVFARFGGEEFVILARGISHANIGRFAERLRAAVERLEIASEAAVLRVTISIGVASIDQLTDKTRMAEDLMRLADERLYRAKTEGRNRVCM